MDEFFSGLDCRLRVSGMLADSIMMGIVNSAMEDAYQNSCSKEGDLVRLKEKSRFCELATMQLEWCLKFLQEESNSNGVVDSSCDRQKLLSDLLKTRDRIHNRLEETELAIVKKDRELSERVEIESDLRYALEAKDGDISSLHNALGLERQKSKRNEGVKKIAAHGLTELKGCVDQQLWRIRGKLEDGQRNLQNLMRRISSRSLDLDKVISAFDWDGEEGSFGGLDVNSKLMMKRVGSLNLEIELKAMAIDMDILHEKIDSSFKMMASSVSLFKSILDEQRWVWNVEREAINIIMRGFLREMRHKFNVEPGVLPVEDIPLVMLDTDWDAFMGDVTSLHNELEKLVTQSKCQSKPEGDKELRKKDYPSLRVILGGKEHKESLKKGLSFIEKHKTTSPRGTRVDTTEELALSSPSRLSVAEKIKSHEFIIRNKIKRSESLKTEISREAGSSMLKSEKSLDSVKEIISRVNTKVESIIKEKAKLVTHCNDLQGDVEKDKKNMQNYSSESLIVDKEPKVIQSIEELTDPSGNRFSYHLIDAKLCEELKQINQEKEDLETRCMILEETYTIIFSGLMRTLRLEYIECSMDSCIREDIYRIIFREMVKEWSKIEETSNIERLVLEETYSIVISEVIKDILFPVSLLTGNCHNEDLPSDNGLFQFSQTSKRGDTMQKLELLTNLFELGEDFEFRERFEDALPQIQCSKMQPRELISSVPLPLDEGDEPRDQVTSISGSTQDENCMSCLPARSEERKSNLLKFIAEPLTEFSQIIMDFEVKACNKIRVNMKRLEILGHHLTPLAVQVNSIKKQEMLYQKAFTRRCNDLQTAEIEVDLLGDEVDLLHSLVEKIYKVLNHYSPSLQQYSAIMDVQRLIWKQLNVEEPSKTRQ